MIPSILRRSLNLLWTDDFWQVMWTPAYRGHKRVGWFQTGWKLRPGVKRRVRV